MSRARIEDGSPIIHAHDRSRDDRCGDDEGRGRCGQHNDLIQPRIDDGRRQFGRLVTERGRVRADATALTRALMLVTRRVGRWRRLAMVAGECARHLARGGHHGRSNEDQHEQDCCGAREHWDHRSTHGPAKAGHYRKSRTAKAGHYSTTRRSRSALAITDTELNVIAALAIIGLRSKPKNGYRTPAATGTPSTLYTKAKNRFCRIFLIVARLRRLARTMPRRSPLTSVTAALSIATSVPLPIAMPTSAFASAGASLIPSPAIATTWPSRWRRSTTSAFCAGSTSASTRSIPTILATASAVARRSPVTITTVMPSLRSDCTASRALGLIGSVTASNPADLPSIATKTTVCPSRYRGSARRATSVASTPSDSRY